MHHEFDALCTKSTNKSRMRRLMHNKRKQLALALVGLAVVLAMVPEFDSKCSESPWALYVFVPAQIATKNRMK
jgi:hypothetical protein